MKKKIYPKILLLLGITAHLPRLVFEGTIIAAIATLGTVMFLVGLVGIYKEYSDRKRHSANATVKHID
jgi:hypothetical protein